ncbi:MAG TPA: hypothetical protein VF037_00730 [Gemmatimonadales bacterium]
MRALRATCTLIVLAGCSDGIDPGNPPAPEFAIADRTLWAGSAIVIESDAFVTLDATPEVSLGGGPLSVTRTAPGTFEARLPTTASGDYVPTIALGGTTYDLPAITVAGFTRAEEFDFLMYLGAEAMPGTGHATLVGATIDVGEGDGRLSFVHLDEGTRQTFEGAFYDFDGLRTPGASYRPGVMFGQSAEGIHPLTVAAGSIALEDPIPLDFARQIAELGEGVYLVTSHHHVTVSDGSFTQQVEESQGIALSREAGRATVWAGNTINGGGLPVFTVPGGALAYKLTEVERPTAVEFSPDGELLAVAGSGPGSGNMFRIFRASDGALLEELTLSGPPVALAFDPVRPFIYVGVGGSEAVKPSVMVFDRVTLELLGHMSAEAADLSCEAGCAEAEIAVSAEPAVYLAGFLNSPLRSFRFSLPDAP